MPIPWSSTRTSAKPSTARAVTRIGRPASLYFDAFVSRFAKTCSSLAGSQSTGSGFAASTLRVWPLCASDGRVVSIARASTSAMETRSRCS